MKRFKKLWSRRAALIIGVVAVSAVFFGFKLNSDHNFQIAKNLDIFNSIVKELDMFYVDSINPNKLVNEGIDAMLSSLDPYTNYFPEENQDELEQMVNGTYGGIGALVAFNKKEDHVVIMELFEGMPAAKCGLKVGDVLMKINGADLKGKSSEDVNKLLRGPEGTSFNAQVKRLGSPKLVDLTIVRRTIELPTIPYYGEVGDHIGYIALNSFSGNPSKDFKQAFLNLKKQGITSLVIDMRNNPGGREEEAVEIANFFLPRGKVIVTNKGRLTAMNNVFKTTREPIDTEIPIAVLVNSGTASAAEILTGALQDYDRAVILGTRTYGKGLVQQPRQLPYGGSIKITTAKYYIPSGRCIQAIDYKNRNSDGSVGKIPEDKTKLFHTAAGRPVRDGGGILPDIVIEPEKMPNILYYLEVVGLEIFDYANDYCLKHPTIAPAADFGITDADYANFKAQVKRSNFKYDQQSEKILKTLKEAAEFEGYYKNAASEFASLEKKLSHNLEHDLNYFSKDIKDAINSEIVKRYYYQKGAIIQQLRIDKNLERASKVLNDKAAYKKLLGKPQPAIKK
jgi:carboxyl-terminal processing protease